MRLLDSHIYVGDTLHAPSHTHTVFPRIVCAQSIHFNVCVMRGQFEGTLYLRAQFNSTDHAANPRHIVNSLYLRVLKRNFPCHDGNKKFAF